MIELNADSIYILDLKDDFVMNETKDLYQFIDEDPVKAFYLGVYIKEWFDSLDQKQQYLYSKQLRHNQDIIPNYKEQIKFWTNKFPNKEADASKLYEYILNNMFWNEITEELDRVKIALFFGQSATLISEDE